MISDDIIFIQEDQVSCDGNGREAGHPRVYLDLSKTGEVYCPYCSKHYKKANVS